MDIVPTLIAIDAIAGVVMAFCLLSCPEKSSQKQTSDLVLLRSWQEYQEEIGYGQVLYAFDQ
jgi:hypothetical protein